MSKQAKPRNVATLLNRAKLEYLVMLVLTYSLATRTVWNYSSFGLLSDVDTFLAFLTFSLATRTVGILLIDTPGSLY